MNQDPFDQLLKHSLKEKAPAGFTDNMMDKLAHERQFETSIAPVSFRPNVFLILFYGMFGLAIFSAFYFDGSVNADPIIFNYLDQLLANIHFQIDPMIKLLVFSIAAIFGFLALDYMIRSRKSAYI